MINYLINSRKWPLNTSEDILDGTQVHIQGGGNSYTRKELIKFTKFHGKQCYVHCRNLPHRVMTRHCWTNHKRDGNETEFCRNILLYFIMLRLVILSTPCCLASWVLNVNLCFEGTSVHFDRESGELGSALTLCNDVPCVYVDDESGKFGSARKQ